MDWYIAAPFIHDPSDGWLTRFVPNEDGHFKFSAVAAPYRHDRSRKFTGLRNWGDYFRHGSRVWEAARSGRGPSGILTSFPQLSITIGLRKRMSRSPIPLVAWTFNLGTMSTGVRRHLARFALSAVDRVVVHSTAEVTAYSRWLDLPATRFQFVPLQRPTRHVTVDEDLSRPFLLSMGSAHRDYRLLFAVLSELGYPAIVVAGPHAVAGLTVPSNVEIRSGLTAEQCFELLQRARLSVIPVANRNTASGQVSLLDAMSFARPVIVTECPASVDYVTHGHDALLVKHGEHEDIKSAIRLLWDDDARRNSLGRAARETATARYSDDAI